MLVDYVMMVDLHPFQNVFSKDLSVHFLLRNRLSLLKLNIRVEQSASPLAEIS